MHPQVKADLHPPLPAQESVQEEEEEAETSPNPQLAAEARALSAHIASIHKERYGVQCMSVSMGAHL